MIEKIILRRSGRGMDILQKHIPENFCERSAHALLALPKGTILLTTGFYVDGFAETDGPLGTQVLSSALKMLGYHPVIVTDMFCNEYFESERLEVRYVPLNADLLYFTDMLQKEQPVGMISIERCGQNTQNDYANMRGISIRNHTAPVDLLFELAQKLHIPTWGIGDGGNEIGMGNLKNVISEKLSLSPCVNKVDYLIISTVSNWGAFGLTAYLEKLTGQKVLPSYSEMRRFLERTVALGSIDGILKTHTCTVDGFSAETEKEIVDALYDSLSI